MTSSVSTALIVQQMGEKTLLLVWQGEPAPRSARLAVRLDGVAAAAPFAQIRLAHDGRRHRNILAVGFDPRRGLSSVQVSHRDGGTIADFDGDAGAWKHAVEFDAHVLAAGLPGRERARLVRFLVEVCGSLFRVGNDAMFVAGLRTLLAETVSGSAAMAARCRLTSDLVYCETLVPEEFGERPSAVVLGAEAFSRVAAEPGLLPTATRRPGQALLGLILPEAAVGRGAAVLAFSGSGLVRRDLPPVPSILPGVHEWLARSADGRPDHRRFLLDRLSDAKRGGAAVEALCRELQVLTPGDSGCFHGLDATAALIVTGDSGVLAIGCIDDPRQLADHVEVERRGIARAVPESVLVRFDPRPTAGAGGGPAGAGFAAFLRDAGGASAAPVRLSLRLGSGARIGFADGPTLLAPEDAERAILAAVPDDRIDDALVGCIEPLMRDLFRQRSAQARVREVLDIGRRCPQPKLSVLVPFHADVEILRCRMGVLAADPALADTEFLYLVERAAQASFARRILADLHATYGVASRVVVFAQEPPFGRMIEIAAGLASGAFLALLGRTVVPETQGWSAALLGRLEGQPRCGIVGAQIVNPDHSLLSAGSEIMAGGGPGGGWMLRPLLRGFPRDCAAAAIPTTVAALPGECLVLGRALARDLVARAGEVLSPDAVVAGMCLAARARGLEVRRVAEPAAISYRGRVAEGAEVRSALAAELDRRELARLWSDQPEAAGPTVRARAGTISEAAAPAPAGARRKAA